MNNRSKIYHGWENNPRKRNKKLILIGIILGMFLLLLLGNLSYNMGTTGRVTEEVVFSANSAEIVIAEQIADEEIVSNVDITEYTDVEVKQPVFDDNKLIEFDVPEGKITLNFDLLDYSEWIETEVEDEVEAENFDIDVQESSEKYKWGYDVKLTDLDFMAKIDVASDEDILIIDNQTLKIGKNYISFADLAEQGYTLSINQPVILEEINITEINVTEINVTEINVTEINVTEINVTEINITEINVTEINITEVEEVNVTGEINMTDVDMTEVNITEEVNETEVEVIVDLEIIWEEPIVEGPVIGGVEDFEGGGEEIEEVIRNEIVSSESEDSESSIIVEEVTVVEEVVDITGAIIRGITGFLINGVRGITGLAVQEENVVSVYVQRDFNDTNYSVGDLINLDPTIIRIEITGAEHLDSNLENGVDIYNYVNETDDITYTIPEGQYVRAYFESELTNENYIDLVVHNSQPVTIEIYEQDSEVVIGIFEDVLEGFYFTGLNHTGNQSVFDLKSVGGDVVYDYIHDAAPLMGITYPINGSTLVKNTSIDLNFTFGVAEYCWYSINGASNVTTTVQILNTPGDDGFNTPDEGSSAYLRTDGMKWENENLIADRDEGDYAYVFMNGTDGSSDYDDSQDLYAYEFDLDVPNGAVIDGIEVEVIRLANDSGVDDLDVYLVDDGGDKIGRDRASGTNWAYDGSGDYENVETKIYGSPTDDWGVGSSLTGSMIEHDDFGVSLAADWDGDTGDWVEARVYMVKMKVYWTELGEVPGCDNVTINVPEGNVNVTVYGNDSLGDVGSHNITFDVVVDHINPKVIINAPVDGVTYSSNNINFNITAVDEIGMSSCQVIIDDIPSLDLANTTFVDDYTGSIMLWDKSYNARIFCEDTSSVNNINDTEEIIFYVDSKAFGDSGTDIFQCGDIDVAGTYQMNQSIVQTFDADCININSPDVILDCAGYSITVDRVKDNLGIYANKDNVTIKNCNVVSDCLDCIAVKIENVYNLNISNTTINAPYRGLDLYNVSNSSFDGISIPMITYATTYYSQGIGLDLDEVSNSSFENISASNADFGVNIQNSDYNNFTNMILDDNVFVMRINNSDYNIFEDISVPSCIYGYWWRGGVGLTNSNNNNITNLSINYCMDGISLSLRSDNNYFSNVQITNTPPLAFVYLGDGMGSNGETIFNFNGASNNTIAGGSVSESYGGMGYGVRFYSNSASSKNNNNLIRDFSIDTLSGYDLNFGDSGGGENLNNTLLNVSSDSDLSFGGVRGVYATEKSQIFKKWYYKAHTTNTSGDDVANATVHVYNVTGDLTLNITTNESGWSDVVHITDYYLIGSVVKQYQSSYIAAANNQSFEITNTTLWDSHNLNITLLENIFNDTFVMDYDVTGPVLSGASWDSSSGFEDTSSSVIIIWNSDEGSNSSISCVSVDEAGCSGDGCSGSAGNDKKVISHSLTISGLRVSHDYTCTYISYDFAGNPSLDYSISFTTADRLSITGGGDTSCIPNYKCSNWPPCSSGEEQSRTCIDDNDCYGKGYENIDYEVIESRTCSINDDDDDDDGIGTPGDGGSGGCDSNFECSEWGACQAVYDLQDIIDEKVLLDGERQRKCIDKNNCVFDKIESEECVTKIPVYVKKVIRCGDEYIEVYDEKDILISRMRLVEGIYQKLDVQMLFDEFGYCPYCYDGVKNYEEDETDCQYSGVDCPRCSLERPFFRQNYSFMLISLMGLTFLSFIFIIWYLILLGKRRKVERKTFKKVKSGVLDMKTSEILKRVVHRRKTKKRFRILRILIGLIIVVGVLLAGYFVFKNLIGVSIPFVEGVVGGFTGELASFSINFLKKLVIPSLIVGGVIILVWILRIMIKRKILSRIWRGIIRGDRKIGNVEKRLGKEIKTIGEKTVENMKDSFEETEEYLENAKRNIVKIYDLERRKLIGLRQDILRKRKLAVEMEKRRERRAEMSPQERLNEKVSLARDVQVFEKGIARLKELRKELDKIKDHEKRKEVIRKKMKNVGKIPEVEREIRKLKGE